MAEITIAIADPHPVIRVGIASFCGSQPGWRVAGECGGGKELAELIRTAQPRYTIADPSIFDAQANDFAQQIEELKNRTRVIGNGNFRDARRIRSLLRAGASAYVLKDGPATELVAAVRAVEAGSTYVTPLASFTLHTTDSEPPDPQAVLSEREKQVFFALGSGARARDVAASLGLSPKTVDTYRASILRKLELDGLASLVRLAASIERGR